MDAGIDKPNMQNQEDSALVSAFQRGDKSAFDRLVLKYKDMVFNLCYRFLGNREEADDCAQETFIKVYRSLKNFRLESAFSTWLYRIAVNTCKNKITSLEYRHRKNTIALNAERKSEDGFYTLEIKDGSLSPKEILEKKEKDMLLQRAIDSLPEDQKAIVVLRDIEGLSYGEISEIGGYKLGTVKSKLARARQALAKKLRA
ncbi:MAG: sigma-70 family RNA polymerase sigma factor [Candidatus Omnitrophota bacterium]